MERTPKQIFTEIHQIAIRLWEIHHEVQDYKNWSDMLYMDSILKATTELLLEAVDISEIEEEEGAQ